MASEIKVDTISEKTSANGVTIDSVSLKDGKVATANSIDSDAYVDGSIDNAHIADDAIDSEHYADGSIDNAHIADDAIDSEHYAAGSIDTAHIADNQITLAKMAGGTDGNIISYDASGDPVAIATGSDGQVLTSTGAGSPPAFEAAAGGAWNLLSTTTASDDATVDLTTTIDSTYTNYCVIYNDVVPATDQQEFHLRLRVGGTYATGSYHHANNGNRSNGSVDTIESTSDDAIVLSGFLAGNATGEAGNGTIYLYNPSGTSYTKMVSGVHCMTDYSNYTVVNKVAGSNNTETAVNGMRFFFASGNVTAGTFKLYGIS